MRLFGDYHFHTAFSRDGHGTIDEAAAMAKEKNLKEIAITEHGPMVWSGVDRKNYAQIRALCKTAEETHGVRVLMGLESNVISADGKIDVTEDERGLFDIMLCGIHRTTKAADFKSFWKFFLPNRFWSVIRWTPKGRIEKNTEVMKNVILNNKIDIWTHPNRYWKIDVVEVARVCAERGTLMELNGKKISFRPIDFERSLAAGAKFIVNSDGHNREQLGRTAVVREFLELVDYRDGDIVNIGDYSFLDPDAPKGTGEPISHEDKSDADQSGKKWWAK